MTKAKLFNVLAAIALGLNAWALKGIVDIREHMARLEGKVALLEAQSTNRQPPPVHTAQK